MVDRLFVCLFILVFIRVLLKHSARVVTLGFSLIAKSRTSSSCSGLPDEGYCRVPHPFRIDRLS